LPKDVALILLGAFSCGNILGACCGTFNLVAKARFYYLQCKKPPDWRQDSKRNRKRDGKTTKATDTGYSSGNKNVRNCKHGLVDLYSKALFQQK
jgi:hypothetical protein